MPMKLERSCAALPRTMLVVSLLLLTACQAALDPRRLERLELGMTRAEVAPKLELESAPDLRWFPPAGGDWLFERYYSEHPHPPYCLGYRDGKLVGVLTNGRMPEGFGWGGSRRGYTAAELADLGEAFVGNSVPLRWRELEPIDAKECRKGPSDTTVTALTILFMPPTWVGFVLLPISYPIYVAVTADAQEQRVAMLEALHALPPRADRSTVEAALGPPTARAWHVLDGRIDVWAYDQFKGQDAMGGSRLGFLDGRLLWIEFGYSLSVGADGRYLPPSRDTASAIRATP
ncbi:MAG: hypothetical protein NXI31_09365 [bacterium]|nr:hypothetical protein [bacterium]